jgi:hypothetical protein
MDAAIDGIGRVLNRLPALERLVDRVDQALPFVQAFAACGNHGYCCVLDCRHDCGAAVMGCDYANSFASCEIGILNGWFGDPIVGPC